MGFRAPVAALAVLVLLASGCAGPGDGVRGVSASVPPPAPSASSSIDTGSIAGGLVDEEQRPVVGARVALTGPQSAETESDEVGKFTFNGLAPGDYVVLVEKLGFESGAKRSVVKAGEIAELRLILVAIALLEEAYVITSQRNMVFNVDNGQLGFNTIEGVFANVSALHGLRCSPCSTVFHFAPKPKGLRSELRFEGTYIAPVGGQFVIMKYTRNWTDGSTGTSQDSNAGTQVNRPIIMNGDFHRWLPDRVKEALKAHDKMKVWYFVNGISVAVNLKVESWTAFSYGAELPEDYRVLPPP